MDLSKLPKLSGNRDSEPQKDAAPGTPVPESVPAPVPPAAPAHESVPYAGSDVRTPPAGPEGFLSLVIGVVLMMVGRGFAEWLLATIAGRAYDTGVIWQSGAKSGQPVTYWELEGFTAVSEATVFLFGFALLIDGIVLLTARWFPRAWPKLVFGAFLVTLLATMANGAAIVIFLTQNGPTPIWATLLTGLGVYTAWQQWSLLREGMAA